MRIALNNVWLTNDGSADVRAWTDARGVRWNGRQVTQEAQFLRAAAAQWLARGNVSNELRFTVTRQHATVAEATAHVLTALGALPTGGQATVVCGAAGETPVTCTFPAVLAEAPEGRFHGTRSDTTFVLRGGAVTVLPPGSDGAVDGDALTATYGHAAGGTVDGGTLGDRLAGDGLALDGGTLA